MLLCFRQARTSAVRWVVGAAGGVLVASFSLAARAEGPQTVSVQAFADQIASAQELAAACARNSTACDSFHSPAREQVTGAPDGTFGVSWDWFADALTAAKAASDANRVTAMDAVRAHLRELASEAVAVVHVPPAEFPKARLAANAALARPEFRVTEQPSWLDRQIARFEDWLLRFFTGMDRLGKRAPWLAPLIEWTCFGLAAAGLLWFVRASLARQALRISLADSAGLGPQRDRGSADWARLAEKRAAASDWREAVHCLYWAAISLLESRRAWKPNLTRTPREYVQLLQPGSAAQSALRALTRSLETIWYGQTSAEEHQYRQALGSFRLLEAARAERLATAPGENSSPPSLAALGGT